MLTIDWTHAPEWANFAAMDCDGEWFFYEEEPRNEEGVWNTDKGRYEFIETHYSVTLHQRPTSPATLNNMDNY